MPVGPAGAIAVNVLTDKQEKFAILVAAGKHLIEAYREAYPNSKAKDNAVYVEASRMAANPKIALRIEQLRKPMIEAAIQEAVIDKAWVMKRLQLISDRCVEAVPLFDKKGNRVMVETEDGQMGAVFEFDSAGANRATELIGKELSMFIDRKEAGKPGAFASLPDADREKALEASTKQRMVRLGLARAERAPPPSPKGGGKVIPIRSKGKVA